MSSAAPAHVGPILFCRGYGAERLWLAALVGLPSGAVPTSLRPADTEITAPTLIGQAAGVALWRYEFSLPAIADTGYCLDQAHYPVCAALAGDLRIGYISCNGMEQGDAGRGLDERNLLWQRLAAQHAGLPLNLLLHGGDQIYADEMLAVDPVMARWGDLDRECDLAAPFTEDMRKRMRDYLCGRYMDLYRQPAIAGLLARVPSLMMWDDHDICDGWGSLSAARLDCAVGQGVYAVARECFQLFQLARAPDSRPGPGAEPANASLGWRVALPGLSVIAPDLRSERRPDRVMEEAGWRALADALDAARKSERVLLLSSVPVLGPRLSWIEKALALVPRAQKYEDDLRDQWQSRCHREQWRRLLRQLLQAHEQRGTPITILSGEIHLATRGEMRTRAGPLHQLVASGIAHPPPPKAYALCLGGLARLGAMPLPDHPIRLHPLPGRRAVYTAQRNYLMLERRNGHWTAYWELDATGRTAELSL